MQGNRKFDSAPERRLRSALHRSGLRFFKHRRPVPGLRSSVDVVFPSQRLALFVDGCFWHGCPDHGTKPQTNREWWQAKLERNRQRDADDDAVLSANGWTVMRIWEHVPVEQAVRDVREALRGINSGLLKAPRESQ